MFLASAISYILSLVRNLAAVRLRATRQLLVRISKDQLRSMYASNRAEYGKSHVYARIQPIWLMVQFLYFWHTPLIYRLKSAKSKSRGGPQKITFFWRQSRWKIEVLVWCVLLFPKVPSSALVVFMEIFWVIFVLVPGIARRRLLPCHSTAALV